MARLAIIIGLLMAIAVGGFVIGQRWDAKQEAQAEVKTLEKINEATTDPRGPDDIRNRLHQLAQ